MSGLLNLIPSGGVVHAIGAVVAKPIVAFWRWAITDVYRSATILLLIVVLAHWLVIDPAVRRERDSARAAIVTARDDLRAEKNAHAETIRSYQQSSAQAQAAQAQNLTRVAAEQAAQTRRITEGYENDLALLRVRRDYLAQQLRQATTTGSSVPAAVHLPGTGEGSGGTAQAAGHQGLPAACAPMNLDERFVASAQALQLDALIDWVLAQSALEMNP